MDEYTLTTVQEVAHLLRLPELTSEQAARVNLLTVEQFYPELKDKMSAVDIPRYTISIDKCVVLCPSGLRWILTSPDGKYPAQAQFVDMKGFYFELHEAKILPIAMLKAVWSFVP